MELQLFTTQDGRSLDWIKFMMHPLGRLYITIPFQSYAKLIPKKSNNGAGRKPWFDIRGGIGLQVLKHYYGLSDEKLIDQLNENKMMQYFCGINLKAGQRIKDADIVSRWRLKLGILLHNPEFMRSFQRANIEGWKDQLGSQKINLADATCYESYVRYPTDVKILWESLSYLYKQLKIICKFLGISMPRTKYLEQEQKYKGYQRRRKKSYKVTKQIRRRLLYLLNKLLGILPNLVGLMKAKQVSQNRICKLKRNFYVRISIIKKVYEQQQLHFDNPKAKIKDRIISLAKPYLRPIVRGKEIKRVEFGMKVHEMQIDGINFIEHWNFNAFHEGIRMKKTLWLHQYLFRQKCKMFGGDKIYANNKNRKYCSSEEIQTCFPPKGRAPKDKMLKKQKEQLRQLIGKERATRLEGSFGNKKNHYLLGKIKAKQFFTELSWIFFGNLAANAVAISNRAKAPPTE